MRPCALAAVRVRVSESFCSGGGDESAKRSTAGGCAVGECWSLPKRKTKKGSTVVTSVRPCATHRCESVSVPVLIVRDRVCEPCVKNRNTDQHAAHRVRGIAATGPSVTKCEVNVQRSPGTWGRTGM